MLQLPNNRTIGTQLVIPPGGCFIVSVTSATDRCLQDSSFSVRHAASQESGSLLPSLSPLAGQGAICPRQSSGGLRLCRQRSDRGVDMLLPPDGR